MKSITKIIQSGELKQYIENKKAWILDVRSVDAYNGWKFKNEVRGGHIRGAKTLPSKWTQYIDWMEIIHKKNFKKEDRIILYGYDDEEINVVASMFERAGYSKILKYPNFLEEWVSDPKLPMENLKRQQYLVPAEWVRDIVEGKVPQQYPPVNPVIVHAHYRNRDAYLSGHIPGAIDMDTLSLESPDTWNRRSPEELADALLSHGITSETTVILYGKFMFPDNRDEFPGSAAGHLGAIRCAFIMMYAGVKDVRVLNGGFQSWRDKGYEISRTDEPKIPAQDFGTEIPLNPGLAVDIEEAKRLLASKNGDLVCVRSLPEYLGEVSGYNYIEKSGRIPGTVFGNCGSDAYHMENYRNPDHTMREYHETEKQWKEAGITPDMHLAFYCGTGWRGSEAFYNAWLMGWPKVSVFDGGWYEWSSNPDNPIESGPVSSDFQVPGR